VNIVASGHVYMRWLVTCDGWLAAAIDRAEPWVVCKIP
jgi:hypothetical protein